MTKPTLTRKHQDRKTILFEEYEKLREKYLAVFGEEAPHCQPLEMELMAADIREAIEQGKPMKYPKGYVT